MILHTVSSEDPISRACRRAAEDVLRLSNVRAAAKLVLQMEYPVAGSERTTGWPRGRKLWSNLRRLIEES